MLVLHVCCLDNLEETYVTGSSELLVHFKIPDCLSRIQVPKDKISILKCIKKHAHKKCIRKQSH